MNTIHRQRIASGRVILAGAPLALGLVGLGLVGLGRSGPGLPAAHVAHTAQVARPTFLQQMRRAVSAARSFELVVDQSSDGPTGAALSEHVAAVAVRMGGTLRQDATLTLTAAGHPLRMEIASSGTRMCLRAAHARTWTCRTAPPSLAALLAPSATGALVPAGAHLHSAPVGRKPVAGRLCVGYAYSYTAPTVAGHATLWLDTATARPVQDDAVITITAAPGRPPVTIRETAVWSHWNDPTLRIPAVPGL